MAIDNAKATTPPNLLGIDLKLRKQKGNIILIGYELV